MGRLTHKTIDVPGYKANKGVRAKDCMDKLGELEDAEEDGRLIILPCKVGDSYYRIENDGVNPTRIRAWNVRNLESCVNMIGDIGKRIFLSREEAEEALKRMEDV